MKISKLHIDQYRHLENLTFDFTYQTGGRKGQPLDKICFIGQSASGKTGLLELVNKTISQFYDSRIISKDEILAPLYFEHYNIEMDFEADSIAYKHKKDSIEIDHKKYNFQEGTYSGGAKEQKFYPNTI
jgi:recombinational DNA repair ATPase RecF